MDITDNTSVREIDEIQDYQTLQQLGNCYISLERYEEASRCYEKAALTEPDEADPYVGLAAVAFETNLLEDAENAFRVAIRLNPKCAAAYAGLASLAQRKTDYRRAFDLYLKCLELDNDNLTALLGLFQASCQMGSFAKVIHYLKLYLNQHPRDKSVMLTLAVLYMKDQRPVRAREILLDILKLEPRHKDAVNLLEEAEHIIKQKNQNFVA